MMFAIILKFIAVSFPQRPMVCCHLLTTGLKDPSNIVGFCQVNTQFISLSLVSLAKGMTTIYVFLFLNDQADKISMTIDNLLFLVDGQ